MHSITTPRPRRIGRGRWLALALAAAMAAVIGVAAPGRTAQAAPASPGPAAVIRWGGCPPAPPGTVRDPRLTCGTLKVPLDYRNPRGATITVEVSRLATSVPGKRIGDLLLNPGGPGDPGLDMPETMAAELPASVLDRYDLIGFDPRGVGSSTPQSCGLPDTSAFGVFPYPAPGGSIAGNVAAARATAAQCAAADGARLRYFTTQNTARDMDRIRQALGDSKISYWGQSYGTYLGTVYSTLFPQRVSRMILEGDVDPGAVWQGSAEYWGKGMAERFPDAARAAAAQNATLGLGSTVPQVTASYLALAARLDRQPAADPAASLTVTGADLRNFTYGLLLHNETIPVLLQFWKAVADLDAGQLTDADAAVLAEIYEVDPTPGVPADNEATVFLAITCGDSAWSHNIAGYAAGAAASRRAWPLTAGLPDDIWPCAFWPAPIQKPVTVTDHGARNILLLQNRRDNATPWDSALGLRRALGRRAAFVGVDNGGHYVYDEGSACADQAANAFLTTGKLPAHDLYCTDVAAQS